MRQRDASREDSGSLGGGRRDKLGSSTSGSVVDWHQSVALAPRACRSIQAGITVKDLSTAKAWYEQLLVRTRLSATQRSYSVDKAGSSEDQSNTSGAKAYIGNSSPFIIHGVPNLSISIPKRFAQ